jgi:hypothetical protein
MSRELNLKPLLDQATKLARGETDRERKKNFAEHLSRQLAQAVADGLRSDFRGITPTHDGKQHERATRSAKGVKKLDVNYSTADLGLGLGVSIKTVTAKDPKGGRFGKNYTRIDNELRAEAKDYHQRQPYAVMVALIFLPEAACHDGSERTPSSFGSAVKQFRYRANRRNPTNEEELFERVFVCCYADDGAARGTAWFFDVMRPPPRTGRPVRATRLSFAEVLDEIKRTYDMRNDPPFEWASDSE